MLLNLKTKQELHIKLQDTRNDILTALKKDFKHVHDEIILCKMEQSNNQLNNMDQFRAIEMREAAIKSHITELFDKISDDGAVQYLKKGIAKAIAIPYAEAKKEVKRGKDTGQKGKEDTLQITEYTKRPHPLRRNMVSLSEEYQSN